MCRSLFCLSVFVLLLVSSASADLVGHWKLDEGSGTTVADSSGNGNDGTFENAPTWIQGISGGALEFHGTGAANGQGDRVNCGNGASLDITGPISIALWIRPEADDPEGTGMATAPLCKALSGSSPSWSFQVRYGWGGAPSPNMAFTFNTSPRAWAFVGRKLERGEWVHIACSYDGTTLKCFVNGEQTDETPMGPITSSPTPVLIGSDGWGSDWIGAIDDVRMYDNALTEPEILATMEGQISPQAWGPTPKNGEMYTQTWANLKWKPGPFAVSHDVYIGDNFDDVNDGAANTFVGNQTTESLIVGFSGYPLPDGLAPGTTYYWRIDEVNDADPNSPWKGDIWSFWIPPKTAYNPSPINGAMFEQTNTTLSWTAGYGTKLNYVYFGKDAAEVEAGAPGALKGQQPTTTFDPGPLEIETVYYWKVDEFDGVETNAGDVWSFRTVPDIAVTNPNLMLWWKLDEDQGTTAVDWSGHGNHGTIFGDAKWTDGYQGTALTFGDNVYVESVGYDGPTGASPRTCCAWIRSTVTGNHNIMSWGQNVAGQKWRMRTNGAEGVLRIEVNGGYHYGVTPIADGHWHHVAVTFEDDGSPDVLDTLLYVDGQLDGTGASQATAIDTAAGPVRIGESPWHNAPFLDQIDDARVYDKVLTAAEIQQVMLGDTKLAGNPNPAAYATVDIRDISSLSWSRGDTASSHDVYFGADRDGVANATTDSPEFQGNQTTTSLSVTDKVEFGGGDYYWRVDEVQADGTVIAGTIWKFTVPDYLIVDDIESYNDLPEDDPASNRIYLSWIDGFGTTTNGAVVGNLDVPLTERANVHGGFQAMPYTYDNNLKTSEATLTLAKHDWTAEGVTKLSLWFRGDAANSAERMYIALNGTAVVYNDDPAVTQKASWTEWVIDLSKFGIDLTNVSSITIGIGTKNAPAAGGTGTMYFDDIRLIR